MIHAIQTGFSAALFFTALMPMLTMNPAVAQKKLTLTPIQDAMVFSCGPCGYADNNYGGNLSFFAIAWTNNGHNSNARGLIRFDLSQLPSNSKITKASLSLYNDPGDRHGGHASVDGNSNTALLQQIIGPWEESTVTWQNQPGTSDFNQVTLPESTDPHQHYIDIDVTDLVAQWVSDPANNNGLMLKMATERPYRRMVFTSRDHPDSRLHPTLHVTYSKAKGKKKR